MFTFPFSNLLLLLLFLLEIDLKTKCVVEVKGDQTVLHYVHVPPPVTTTPTPNGKNSAKEVKEPKEKDGAPTHQNGNSGTFKPPKVSVIGEEQSVNLSAFPFFL